MQTVEDFLSWIQHKPSLIFLADLARDFKTAEVFFVGGALRDWFLNRPMDHVDCDFVVRGIQIDLLIAWLQKHGSVDVVGKTFGVIKFRPNNAQAAWIDIALPRTEQSTPDSLGGYRDVLAQFNATLPITDDLSRRDFTVNALALNLRTHNLIDPFRGQQDLENKTLRAVGHP